MRVPMQVARRDAGAGHQGLTAPMTACRRGRWSLCRVPAPFGRIAAMIYTGRFVTRQTTFRGESLESSAQNACNGARAKRRGQLVARDIHKRFVYNEVASRAFRSPQRRRCDQHHRVDFSGKSTSVRCINSSNGERGEIGVDASRLTKTDLHGNLEVADHNTCQRVP